MVYKNRVLALIIILIVTLGTFAIASAATSGNVKTVTIMVDKMTCEMCAATLEPQLKKTKGVLDARVSYEKKNAWIKYDDHKVTIAELRKAIDDAGFKAR